MHQRGLWEWSHMVVLLQMNFLLVVRKNQSVCIHCSPTGWNLDFSVIYSTTASMNASKWSLEQWLALKEEEVNVYLVMMSLHTTFQIFLVFTHAAVARRHGSWCVPENDALVGIEGLSFHSRVYGDGADSIPSSRSTNGLTSFILGSLRYLRRHVPHYHDPSIPTASSEAMLPIYLESFRNVRN